MRRLLALKGLQSLGYFAVSLVLPVWLSADFGARDLDAGAAYGAFGTLVALFGVPGGLIADRLGVRRTLLLGNALLLGSRLVLALTDSRTVFLATLLSATAFGEALGIPVLATAVSRVSGGAGGTTTAAYGDFVVAMNLAVLVVSLGVDGARAAAPAAPYRLLALCSAATALVSLVVVWRAPVGAFGSSPPPSDERRRRPACSRRLVGFLAFVTVMVRPAGGPRIPDSPTQVLVRVLFRHLDATFPKFFLRQFGPEARPWLVSALNPALVVALVPLATRWRALARQPALPIIALGSAVACASVLFLVAAPERLGASVLFVATLSVGEALYSPRLYDATAAWAPPGQEGAYFGFANAPLFAAKAVAGAVSGALLERFCPAAPCAGASAMWAVIAAMSGACPVLLGLLWMLGVSPAPGPASAPALGVRGKV